MYKIFENKIANLVNFFFNKMEVKDICSLRGLDGRCHFFYTVLIFFRKRTLYKDIGKHPNFKAKLFEFFLYLMTVYR